MSKLYNVGIYCRLSMEDAKNAHKHNYIDGDDSSSIENQRQMLSQFVLLQGWLETKVYCDDGYGGGTFNRPGFQQMIGDAQKGVIDLILCKDLSRLGRDYIEVGRYTDILFPSWGCRFIALLDEIDTANDDNDMLHFRSLMNDYHLKDLSNKIKIVFNAKAMKSGYLNGRPPYGYMRKEKKAHILVPEPEAAEVIRRIFAMRKDGASYNTIARTLNEDGVITANDYWAVKSGKPLGKKSLWYVQVVKNILRCEMYNGTLINNKKPSLSYKAGDKRRKTDESEWIRNENAHEPLIDSDTWEKVQELERATIEKGKKQAKRKPALFGSKLFCLDCGTSLSSQTVGHKKNGVWTREGTQYQCHRHLMSGRAVCSKHTIGENPLKAIILTELRLHKQSIVLDETLIMEKLKKQMAVDNSANQLFLQKEVRRLRALLDETDRLGAVLYEDKVAGKISPETFTKLLDKNEQERKKRQSQFDETNLRLTTIQDKILNISKWVEVIKKHTELSDITRPDVEELIDRIEVGESSYCTRRKRVQEIRIYWRFVGLIAD